MNEKKGILETFNEFLTKYLNNFEFNLLEINFKILNVVQDLNDLYGIYK